MANCRSTSATKSKPAAACDNIAVFFGEDIFIAFGAVLLIDAFLKENGIQALNRCISACGPFQPPLRHYYSYDAPAAPRCIRRDVMAWREQGTQEAAQ
jgi:hypothetical protein